MENLADNLDYKEWAKNLEVELAHRIPTKTDYSDHCGFKVEIQHFENGEGHWDYTRAIISKDRKTVATMPRNYSSMPFILFKHENGNHYFVSGEDYQGYTIIELETGKHAANIPSRARMGLGYCATDYECYAAFELETNGCYWGGDFFDRVYDLTDPMNVPWSYQDTWEDEDEDEDEDE